MKGGPAEAAGIQRGDVIVTFDGKAVAEAHHLPPLVAAAPVGKEVELTILRGGAEQTLRVKVGKMPAERPRMSGQAEPAEGKWGMALRDLDAPTAERLGVSPGEGVLVAAVRSGSPADRAGVRAGDVLLEVNRQKVTSVNEAQAAAHKDQDAQSLLLFLRRGGANLFAALEPK
jgi:serine protease Do